MAHRSLSERVWGIPQVPAEAMEIAHWVYVDPAHDHAVNVVVHSCKGGYVFSRYDSVLSDRASVEVTYRWPVKGTPQDYHRAVAELEAELSQLGPFLKGPAGGFSLSPLNTDGRAADPVSIVPFAGIPVNGGEAMTLHLFASPDRQWLLALAEVPDAPASSLFAFSMPLPLGRGPLTEEVVLHAKGSGLHRAVLLRFYRHVHAMGYRSLPTPEAVAAVVQGGLDMLVRGLTNRVRSIRQDLRDEANESADAAGTKSAAKHAPVPTVARDVTEVLRSRYLASLYERYLPPQVTPWALRRESQEGILAFMVKLRKGFSNIHQHNLTIVEAALLAEGEIYQQDGRTTATVQADRLVRLVREAHANLSVAAHMP